MYNLSATNKLLQSETSRPEPPTPRKALRGGISKVNLQQACQLLTTIPHKMAPRTRTGCPHEGPCVVCSGVVRATLGEVSRGNDSSRDLPRVVITEYTVLYSNCVEESVTTFSDDLLQKTGLVPCPCFGRAGEAFWPPCLEAHHVNHA